MSFMGSSKDSSILRAQMRRVNACTNSFYHASDDLVQLRTPFDKYSNELASISRLVHGKQSAPVL